MKIYEVFARKRCWACLWFICFSRNNFDVFRLVFFKGSQWAKLQRSAQVSRLAGAHKALGTLRTGWSGHRRTHTASSFRNSAWHFRRSVCLVSEGQLIALVRSWSVDVSFLWSDPFLFVVSHWCLSRWEAMAAASCHCKRRCFMWVPKPDKLRTCGDTSQIWQLSTTWRTSLTQQFKSEHHTMLKKSAGSSQIYRCSSCSHNERNEL